MQATDDKPYQKMLIAKTDVWSDIFAQALTARNPHFKGVGGRNALFETVYLLNNIDDIDHKASDVMYLTRLYDAKIHYVLIDLSNTIVERMAVGSAKGVKTCSCLAPREACSDCP